MRSGKTRILWLSLLGQVIASVEISLCSYFNRQHDRRVHYSPASPPILFCVTLRRTRIGLSVGYRTFAPCDVLFLINPLRTYGLGASLKISPDHVFEKVESRGAFSYTSVIPASGSDLCISLHCVVISLFYKAISFLTGPFWLWSWLKEKSSHSMPEIPQMFSWN